MLKDVPYGMYAISGFHDKNNNNKVDRRSIFKIPKEGMITSNNANSKFRPAKFDEAKFELKSPELKLNIKAFYY